MTNLDNIYAIILKCLMGKRAECDGIRYAYADGSTAEVAFDPASGRAWLFEDSLSARYIDPETQIFLAIREALLQ